MQNSTFYLLASVLVCFMALCVYAAFASQEVNKEFLSDCEPTELYAIGNKGHRIKIYRCGDENNNIN